MGSTAHPSAQQDGADRLSAGSPIDDLRSIAPLILDLKLQEEVLAGFDSPEKLEAVQIFQCAAQLTSMTDWKEEQLIEALGCTMRTVRDFKAVEMDGLQRCRVFLRLVTSNSGLVQMVPDRRHVVVSSGRLLKAIGGDVTLLQDLLKTEVEGYTAIDLIRLGEIEAASDKVRLLGEVASVGQIAAADDPFAEVSPIHLSTTRMQMLIQGRRDQLGVEVARYMELHIEKCEGGCKEAYEYEKSRLS